MASGVRMAGVRMTGRRDSGQSGGEKADAGAAGPTARQRGVSLVELLVSMAIFMVFSLALMSFLFQFLHVSQASAVRAESSSKIAVATQRIDRWARYASTMCVSDDGSRVVFVIPESIEATGSGASTGSEYASVRRVVLTYDKNVDSPDDSILGYSSVVLSRGTSGWERTGTEESGTILTGLLNGGSTSSDQLFSAESASSSSGCGASSTQSRAVTFAPAVGSYAGGRIVSVDTTSTFVGRNAGDDSASTALTADDVDAIVAAS